VLFRLSHEVKQDYSWDRVFVVQKKFLMKVRHRDVIEETALSFENF